MQEKLNKRLCRLKADVTATELAIWICGLLESPTEFNTSTEICLTESTQNKQIQIGLYSGHVTDKPFNCSIMRKVADIFGGEDNYTAEFVYSTFSYGYPFLKVTKQKAP